MATVKQATVELSPDLLGYKARPQAYKQVKGAAKVEVLAADGSGTETFVTRGLRVNGGSDAPECLVHIDGSRQAGIPLAVVTYAILGGVITDAELASLVAARERAKTA